LINTFRHHSATHCLQGHSWPQGVHVELNFRCCG